MQSSDRIGKKWEVVEEALLLKRVSEGVSHERIAAECKRTPGGIQSRLRAVACRMVDAGKTMDEVADVTQLTPDQIIDTLQKRYTAAPKPPVARTQETPLTLLREIRDLLQTKREPPPKKAGACYRCGRAGHYSPDCYASRHVKGYELD